MAVLPHYSPGYPEWSIEEQPRLLDLINRLQPKIPAPVEVMDSGMLRPKKSLLAVFGITRHVDRVQRLTELTPCENCSYLAVSVSTRAVPAGTAASKPRVVGALTGNERWRGRGRRCAGHHSRPWPLHA